MRSECGFICRENGDSFDVFSPYNGMCFSAPIEDSDILRRWLDGEDVDIPERYRRTIGFCWKSDTCSDDDKGSAHIGPKIRPNPVYTINWFLTTRCNLRCRYCYGQGFMKGHEQADIENTVSKILSYSPLCVVLSGGETLLSPYVQQICEAFAPHIGIIVDTNGTLIDEGTADMFKRCGAVLRISLDSVYPDTNEKARPTEMKDPTERVKRSIEMCVGKGIPVVVHTVVSKINRSDLMDTKKYLESVGVRVWMLLQIACTKEHYDELLPDDPGSDFLSDPYYDEIKRSTPKMKVLLQRTSPYGAILTVPDGSIFVNTDKGWIMLDRPTAEHPDIVSDDRIDWITHSKRYLLDGS